MEKTLNFTDTSSQTVKIGDTTTSFTLVCGNDNTAVDLTHATSITVKLGNASGYLRSTEIKPSKLTEPTAGKITVTFGADLMKSLPAGNCAIEVWVDDSTGTSIYPSDGSTGFTITNNIQSTTGETITTIVFDDFVKEMNKVASEIKDDKGIIGSNLLAGTNNVLTTIKNATNWNWGGLPIYHLSEKLKANQTYTVSCYLEPAKHDVTIAMTTAKGSVFGTTIAAGSKGISTLTILLTEEDVKVTKDFWITFTSQQSDTSAVSFRGFKLENGSVATDWCPNPSEILTQSDGRAASGIFYKSGKMTNVGTGSPYDDLNTFPIGQTVTIAETPDKIKKIKNLPPISDTTGGLTVRTESSVNDTIGAFQIAIDNNNFMYHRICWGASGQWGTWKPESVDKHSNDEILPALSLFQKVGVVGDSYASGELAFDGHYIDHYEISWLQILARKGGFTGTNFSKGGMSTRTWLTDSKCMPLMKSSDVQDLYILALGINDEALGNSYIGSEADINSGADTFYGNYGKIIKAIQAKAPQAKIVIATIANNSDIAAKLNEAIKAIAKHFTIPVIVQLDDPLFNSSFYKDTMIGGHPTGPVYASMAEAFERLIGQSMIDHLDYYKTFKKDA
ncbi:prophage Lp2 protein 53 [Lactiplantibacillus plantarum]|uniref:SGNH/GDSL hydrolase family protein n=1 Tax=Lactiplantibacillus plantarum TaxID=1590 RepID=UPI0038545A39|nr:prophage Lp2 protein 53 [Lactiplantibacillus plantarum]MCG0864539.1 prophage Lp2 protein 53 [Lactiplantibacillus plantarum]